jgi:hypothetical protein
MVARRLEAQAEPHAYSIVEVAATFSAGQIGELRHLAHARYVAEKRSSRVSETLAEQGFLADQWLMAEVAPRRGRGHSTP